VAIGVRRTRVLRFTGELVYLDFIRADRCAGSRKVIPPLRERREDIPDLAHAFLGQLNAAHSTRKRFHRSALSRLSDGEYRGNVRELQNLIERAYFSAVDQQTITDVGVVAGAAGGQGSDAETWFRKLTEGKEDFWKSVHEPYKTRDISRERVRALMDVGLRASRGSYKSLASLLNVDEGEYRRFMDFLRRNKCQPDFRPYRAGFRRLPSGEEACPD
jgi:DNA-binding NtrC family response regulator